MDQIARLKEADGKKPGHGLFGRRGGVKEKAASPDFRKRGRAVSSNLPLSARELF